MSLWRLDRDGRGARIVDFTQPFYATGLGIAVPVGGEANWLPILRTLTSFGFAQAIIALIGLALVVGLLVWFFERHHNEDFGGSLSKGLSSGVWWSTVAMTQRSTGNFGPRTLPDSSWRSCGWSARSSQSPYSQRASPRF